MPCIGACVEAARGTGLSLRETTDIGPDYAVTLREWRRRWEERRSDVHKLGYSERFWRKYRCANGSPTRPNLCGAVDAQHGTAPPLYHISLAGSTLRTARRALTGATSTTSTWRGSRTRRRRPARPPPPPWPGAAPASTALWPARCCRPRPPRCRGSCPPTPPTRCAAAARVDDTPGGMHQVVCPLPARKLGRHCHRQRRPHQRTRRARPLARSPLRRRCWRSTFSWWACWCAGTATCGSCPPSRAAARWRTRWRTPPRSCWCPPTRPWTACARPGGARTWCTWPTRRPSRWQACSTSGTSPGRCSCTRSRTTRRPPRPSSHRPPVRLGSCAALCTWCSQVSGKQICAVRRGCSRFGGRGRANRRPALIACPAR